VTGSSSVHVRGVLQTPCTVTVAFAMLVKLPTAGGDTSVGKVLGPRPLLPIFGAILALSNLPLVTSNQRSNANSTQVPGYKNLKLVDYLIHKTIKTSSLFDFLILEEKLPTFEPCHSICHLIEGNAFSKRLVVLHTVQCNQSLVSCYCPFYGTFHYIFW
jgi:hypothetical protein